MRWDVRRSERRKQPVSDKQGSWLFPECLSQDCLPLIFFFFGFIKTVNSQISQLNHHWKTLFVHIIRSVSLNFRFYFALLSHLSYLFFLLPSVRHQLFKAHAGFAQLQTELPVCMCHTVTETACLTEPIQIKTYLHSTFQERSRSIVNGSWRKQHLLLITRAPSASTKLHFTYGTF